MLYLIWPFSNIEIELAESLYVIKPPTKSLVFQERNFEYLIEVRKET